MNQRTSFFTAFVAALTLMAWCFSCFGDNHWRATKASWYNPGKRMVTAHRTLPIGTKIEVVHGSKRVVVTVAGRGPFVRGRDLDLSRHTFRHLALPSRGVIHVKYRVLHKTAAKKRT